ncbi:MAG: cytidylate kinase-like family protein [Bacteroidales bacterium]|nr:cytidylate kinase-like family protein [Bacteroidales bacterium]MDD5910786.1 cytidylate kinase-like family protein [Bacteroidales bacterium]
MKHIVINIGRQFGCGGLEVARVLGQKLGIPVYDNELITKAAQESGFSAALFKESDETRTSFSFRNWFGVNSSNDYTSQGGLFKIQSDTIKSIAEQGSAIIVGRCADYILRGNKNTLNVFLTASEESRIERISRREGISKEKAEEMLKKKDKERADYYNYYTFGNWGVASTYDLCLDSSKIGIEGTADLIIDFARRANLL